MNRHHFQPFLLRWTNDRCLSRLTTKLSGPGHGPPSYDDGEGAARGWGPLQREVRLSQLAQQVIVFRVRADPEPR